MFIGFAFLSELKDPWHMPVSKLNVLQTLCYLLSTFLNYLDKHGGFGEDDERNTTVAGNTNPPTTSGSKQYIPKYDITNTKIISWFVFLSLVMNWLFI